MSLSFLLWQRFGHCALMLMQLKVEMMAKISGMKIMHRHSGKSISDFKIGIRHSNFQLQSNTSLNRLWETRNNFSQETRVVQSFCYTYDVK